MTKAARGNQNRTTESLLRIAGRMARVGGFALDVATQEIYWSEEMNNILDYPHGAVPDLGEAINLYPEPDRSRLVAALHQCRTVGTPFDLELWSDTAGGRRIRVRAVAEAELDETNTVVRVNGAVQDITESTQLKLEALSVAQQLELTLDAITDAMYVVDFDWRFTFVNPRTEVMLARPKASLIGHHIWEEFAPAVGGAFFEALHLAMETREPQKALDYYAPLDTWFEARAYPTPEGLTVYLSDVGETVRSRRVLEQRQAMLDHATDAILACTLDHEITYWNGGATRMYGWTATEAITTSVRELLHLDTAEFDSATAQALREGEWAGELRKRTRDGRELVVESRWTVITDEQGRPQSILAIDTDITERKELERQFLRTQRLESIGTLAGGLAHDLNNVLAPIMMSTDMLKSHETDPWQLDLIDTIQSSTNRAAAMVRQILLFACGVDGERTAVDIDGLLKEIERHTQDVFLKSIRTERTDAREVPPVLGDRTQLHQVVLNLCVNARDAMPSGGRLQLSADTIDIDIDIDGNEHAAAADVLPGRYVRIHVIDDGVGMTPEVLDRIFEPFYTTKDFGLGTGLGLSTSAGIIRRHGGFITVDSIPDAGTRFAVHLPATLDPEPGTPQPVPGHGVRGNGVRGNGELVLVVDDEQQIRSMVRQSLERFGHHVLEASNGPEAIAVFAQHHDAVAVVLTDMMMPGMDGHALIASIRNISEDVAILVTSGAFDQTSTNLAELQADGFLKKPFAVGTMLRTIEWVLASTRT